MSTRLSRLLLALAMGGCAAPPAIEEPPPPRADFIGVAEYESGKIVFHEREFLWARDALLDGERVGWTRPGITEEAFRLHCIGIWEKGGSTGHTVFVSTGPSSGLHIQAEFACREMLSHGYLPAHPDRCEPWQIFP